MIIRIYRLETTTISGELIDPMAIFKHFNLSCECGTVIKRLAPYKRIEFNQEKYDANVKRHDRIVKWKNAIDNIKLLSIGVLIVIVLVTLIGFLSYGFDPNRSSINNILGSKP